MTTLDYGKLIDRGLEQGALLALVDLWYVWALLVGLALLRVLPSLIVWWRVARAGLSEVDHMRGEQFELYVGRLLRKDGWRVETTARTGDYGGDLVAQRDGERVVFQAKRSSRAVGVPAVQQVAAAVSHYRCDRGIVVTNHHFTNPARVLAKSNHVELWDRSRLATLAIHGRRADPRQSHPQQEAGATPLGGGSLAAVVVRCSRCGSQMVVRNGRYGRFYGCTGFPACRQTQPLDRFGEAAT